MSTKSSIKWRAESDDRIGFHLYDDLADDSKSPYDGGEPLVYLDLNGVDAQIETLGSGGASVTVAIPREAARELGLLPPKAA